MISTWALIGKFVHVEACNDFKPNGFRVYETHIHTLLMFVVSDFKPKGFRVYETHIHTLFDVCGEWTSCQSKFINLLTLGSKHAKTYTLF